MSSRFLVALKVTETSGLKVVGVLVALKAVLSTPIIDGRHSVLQDFGSYGSYSWQEYQLPLLTGFW